MLVGLVLTLPAVALTSTPDQLDAGSVKWLAVSGIGNVAGLLIVYAALRIERVGIVAPITSTEGAVAAAIAAAAGEAIGGGTGLALGVIVVVPEKRYYLYNAGERLFWDSRLQVWLPGEPE